MVLMIISDWVEVPIVGVTFFEPRKWRMLFPVKLLSKVAAKFEVKAFSF